ncbi:MAG: acyl-CoA dehydrogenase family protein [Candidatus Eremiobacteraeota bacterium]|nr:acyl-CoA dehydrogenase family protein [Candidatus Eremiobacteraeota bacterium]MBV8223319.1 acyl-CoA dehydrogenase family protein [Candidatus Eremiobacteraeota bacterium]MBV8282604.1 acyl-CoA dehydrogenase family protein [Candidatus Eremiobacteraeota bacterium]
MNFELTDDQRAVRDMVAAFAARHIAPHAAQWDKEGTFPVELFAKLGELGIMGMSVSERYGGAALDAVSVALAIEELSKADAGVGVTVSVHAGIITRIVEQFASDELKEHYLPKMCEGTWLGAFSLTEPEAGSDAGALRTSAERRGDDYILNGTKQWVTNGGHAKVYVVFARTGGPGPRGISAFLVDRDTPGLSIGRETDKLGIRSSDTVDLLLRDAQVPASRLLGTEGAGYKIALANLGVGRLGIAAQAVGILAACLDTSVRYALDRLQFGRPIGAFQAVSFKIADMAMDLDAARLLLYRAAWQKDNGSTSIDASSKAKLFASTAARKHAAECVQILGGYGFTKEFPAERYYRDAKITEIYEGTSEVQHIVIARELLGRLDERTSVDRPLRPHVQRKTPSQDGAGQPDRTRQ